MDAARLLQDLTIDGVILRAGVTSFELTPRPTC